ncbi:MAG: hypothetical protein A2W00_00430 [Candidatus Eisenbacteria bacterium RBG_16_71_46]|nr:MAG: hypothetical protein A2W00_00430 [Candidatus Eisenbacteria bacterium RBG_16_71_46]
MVRKATLFAACGLLMVGSAFAGRPSPGNSTVPCGIVLVGHDGTTGAGNPKVDCVGKFCVVVMDDQSPPQPIANSTVIIDFALCCNDIMIAQSQNGNPACNVFPATVDCATKTVRALTDATGTVCFTIAGASKSSTVTPGNLTGQSPAACARIFADGTLLGTAQVACIDLDGGLGGGAEGITSADRSVLQVDYFLYGVIHTPSDPYRARSDLDFKVLCVQDISGADLSLWDTINFASGQFGTQASYFNGPFCSCP